MDMIVGLKKELNQINYSNLLSIVNYHHKQLDKYNIIDKNNNNDSQLRYYDNISTSLMFDTYYNNGNTKHLSKEISDIIEQHTYSIIKLLIKCINDDNNNITSIEELKDILEYERMIK